jgi:hypothetical protein
LWPLAPWDSGFQSHQGHGCLSLVECCFSGRSLCVGMSVVCLIDCNIETGIMWRPWPTKGCCAFGRGGGVADDHNLLMYLKKFQYRGSLIVTILLIGILRLRIRISSRRSIFSTYSVALPILILQIGTHCIKSSH